jgi:CTP:molybdopterin cytidylyltransferase MocA
MKVHAVVLAGGILDSENPLYDSAPHGHRSMIPIHGKPMAQWVMDALSASDAVEGITVMGLSASSGLKTPKPLDFAPDAGGMFENIRAGVLRASDLFPEQDKVIIASADVPAVKPEMVDWLIAQVEKNPKAHIYYNVIEKSSMEVRFPQAARSYVRFKDISVCGGDLNVIDKHLFTGERPIWKRLTEARKHPLQQASILGLDTLALVALHMISLDNAVKKICKKLSLEGQALISPYPEMAMDADKPHQLEILRRDLEGQA